MGEVTMSNSPSPYYPHLTSEQLKKRKEAALLECCQIILEHRRQRLAKLKAQAEAQKGQKWQA